MRFVPTAVAAYTVVALRTSHAAAAPPTPANVEVKATPEPATEEPSDPMLSPVARATHELGSWQEALDLLRSRSVELRVAAAAAQRAEAQQRTALAGVLPSINGSAGYTHNLITNEIPTGVGLTGSGSLVTRQIRTPFPDALTGQVTASQPVIALRAWNALGTASESVNASKLSLEDTKRTLALAVANAVVGVVTAERIAELNRLGLRNALSRQALTTRRAALGNGTALDVLRTRQDVAAARSTLVAGDETLRQAREALGLALGVPEQVSVTAGMNMRGLEQQARDTCTPAESIDQRPDVAALRARAEVARRGITDAKTQFAPSVDVRSTVATTTIDTGAAPNTTWNIQALLSVPIWDGGARYGSLKDAHAQHEAALQSLEAGRRKARIEVTQAQRGMQVAEERYRVAASARDLAQETDTLTRTAYHEGRGTSLELIAAAQALREAEIQVALREFDVVKSRVLHTLALASCSW